jgi:hypothetical protein
MSAGSSTVQTATGIPARRAARTNRGETTRVNPAVSGTCIAWNALRLGARPTHDR